MRHEIKTAAVETSEKAVALVTRITKNVPIEVIKQAPQYKGLIARVNRDRNKICNTFVANGCDMAPELHKDFRYHIFFRSDSGVNDPERFVIFFQNINVFTPKSAVYLP